MWPRTSEVLGETGEGGATGTTKGELISQATPTNKLRREASVGVQQFELPQSTSADRGYMTAAGAAERAKPRAKNIKIFIMASYR